MADVAQLVVNGLVLGSIYALGAVGLTLVYQILDLVNFAHGDFLTTGAYVSWALGAGVVGTALPPATSLIGPVYTGLLVLTVVALVATLAHAWARRAGRSIVDVPTDRFALVTGVLATLAAATWLTGQVAVPILLSLVVAGASVAVVSWALDRTLWRKMRAERANLLTLLVVSIGLALALRHLLQLVFTSKLRRFLEANVGQNPSLASILGSLGLDVNVTSVDIWILTMAVLCTAVTWFVMTRTRSGKAMRALADNRDLARVTGIDSERVIGLVWLLGGTLAGIAGALLAMETSLHVNLGWHRLLPIFAAVILGGVGSVTGALLGGYLIGLAEAGSVPVLAALGLNTGYSVAVGFAILIVTLLIRPRGLMGVSRT